jgi:hypothetical protein
MYLDLIPEIPDSDKDALLYVSGCFARQIASSTTCASCKDIILTKSISDEAEDSEENIQVDDISFEPESYISQVNRGGLTIPSEMAFLSCAHAWEFYSVLMREPHLKSLLYASTVSSRKVFVQAFFKYLDNGEETKLFFIDQCCEKGHSFSRYLGMFASKCFNIFSKNYVSTINSAIHENRKRSSTDDMKRKNSVLKSKKLQSETI